MKAWQSRYDTISTGRCMSPVKRLGLYSITACHNSWVTSVAPIEKLVTVTECVGFSDDVASVP